MAITIVNLGALPFTVVGVGLKMGGTIYLPLFVVDGTGSELPKRLQARTSITVLAPARTHEHPSFGGVSAVYVSTDCGMRITGRNGFLRHLTNDVWMANR
ncbi:MAG: hypothetical protein EOP02_32505 [Proteobacteria bacterium]|nr:MAG: hypothetical protein EOP02_32505 [Pseudomonadota bacterium]